MRIRIYSRLLLRKKSTSQPAKNPKSSPKEIENGIQNIQKEIIQKNEVVKKEYHYPPLKLLKRGDGKSQGDSDEHLRKTAKKLQDTLHNFGVNVTVTNVSCGPTVTRYELQPEMGVKVSKIVNLADDIKLNLATPDIRIEAPIPGKAAVGIEVPNKENHAVMLRELLQSQEFQTAKSKLAFAVGKDIAGKPVVTDIAKMPHLLIAGATGSGKSVCINTLIVSILYKATAGRSQTYHDRPESSRAECIQRNSTSVDSGSDRPEKGCRCTELGCYGDDGPLQYFCGVWCPQLAGIQSKG